MFRVVRLVFVSGLAVPLLPFSFVMVFWVRVGFSVVVATVPFS